MTSNEDKTTDPDNWNSLNDVLTAWSDGLKNLLTSVIKPSSATHSTGRTVFFDSANPIPIELLGYDLRRTRAVLQASVTGIFIGTRDQLSSNQPGAIVPAGTGNIELKTTDDVYVIYQSDTAPSIGTVAVSVWEEWVDQP